MPLIINNGRDRMKCHLVKPEELVNLSSLISTEKYKVKLNGEIPIEKQLEYYTPKAITLPEPEEKKEENVCNNPNCDCGVIEEPDVGLRGTGIREEEEKKTSILDDTVSLEEQRLVKLYSHKPSRCGSCKALQRFDGNKYCHVCQKDPYYLNTENHGDKNIQDYHLIKKYQHREEDATKDFDTYMKHKAFMKNYDA